MNHKDKVIVFCTVLFIVLMIFTIIQSSKGPTNNIESVTKTIKIDKSKLNIFCFYVGQADSTLIMNENEVMLIDVGEKSDGEMITQFLKEIGVKRIDYLIGTHSDDDHIGGMSNIIQNFEIGNLYIPDREATNEAYIDLLNTANDNIKIENVNLKDVINLGKAQFVVKWVDNEEKYSDNNSSIVLQLNYGDKKYLFTGDMEKEIEEKLISENKLEDIDILRVAHHGSNSSTSEVFLNEITPEVAIISSGSTYSQFPNVNCLRRILKKIDFKNLYITERDGTIWISSDGNGIDDIKRLENLNLDGAKSRIKPESFNEDYLRSILDDEYAFSIDII